MECDVRALSDEPYGLVKINGKGLRALCGSPPNCLNDPFESINASSTYHGPFAHLPTLRTFQLPRFWFPSTGNHCIDQLYRFKQYFP